MRVKWCFAHSDRYKTFIFIKQFFKKQSFKKFMASSLYNTRLQEIMVVVFS